MQRYEKFAKWELFRKLFFMIISDTQKKYPERSGYLAIVENNH